MSRNHDSTAKLGAKPFMDEMWQRLDAADKQAVAEDLADHVGPGVEARFKQLVERHHRRALARHEDGRDTIQPCQAGGVQANTLHYVDMVTQNVVAAHAPEQEERHGLLKATNDKTLDLQSETPQSQNVTAKTAAPTQQTNTIATEKGSADVAGCRTVTTKVSPPTQQVNPIATENGSAEAAEYQTEKAQKSGDVRKDKIATVDNKSALINPSPSETAGSFTLCTMTPSMAPLPIKAVPHIVSPIVDLPPNSALHAFEPYRQHENDTRLPIACQHISFRNIFQNFSPEEIRLADYQRGNTLVAMNAHAGGMFSKSTVPSKSFSFGQPPNAAQTDANVTGPQTPQAVTFPAFGSQPNAAGQIAVPRAHCLFAGSLANNTFEATPQKTPHAVPPPIFGGFGAMSDTGFVFGTVAGAGSSTKAQNTPQTVASPVFGGFGSGTQPVTFSQTMSFSTDTHVDKRPKLTESSLTSLESDNASMSSFNTSGQHQTVQQSQQPTNASYRRCHSCGKAFPRSKSIHSLPQCRFHNGKLKPRDHGYFQSAGTYIEHDRAMAWSCCGRAPSNSGCVYDEHEF